MAREVASPVLESQGEGKKRGVVSFFKELPVLVALALGIALVIKALLIQAFFIPSQSMEPTLHVGDRVLVNKLTYRFHAPRRGDVVVFKDPYGELRCPKNPEPGVTLSPECNKPVLRKAYEWFAELFGLPTGETKDYIKRIAALPGETIQMENGEVWVCGKPNCTPFNSETKQAVDGRKIYFRATPEEGPQADNYTMPPFRVPEGNYYVLGDNRGNSSDSRVFKSITRGKIIGKAFVLLWPPNRFNGL